MEAACRRMGSGSGGCARAVSASEVGLVGSLQHFAWPHTALADIQIPFPLLLRACRWDIRDRRGVVQEMPTALDYVGGKDYSRGTNFTCMATSGDGFVAVGAKDGRIRLYNSKTLTQARTVCERVWLGVVRSDSKSTRTPRQSTGTRPATKTIASFHTVFPVISAPHNVPVPASKCATPCSAFALPPCPLPLRSHPPQAKTSIPGLGAPITAVDVTYDGKWVLATTDHYLMLVKTTYVDDKGRNSNGFESRMGGRGAVPRLLRLKPEDGLRTKVSGRPG